MIARLLVAALAACAAHVSAAGRILADPAQAHPGFKPHELPFATPRDGLARAQFRSVPFFAVILRTGPRCGIGEPERREVQALFPGNKVFFPRSGCEDAADPKFAFLAAYGGMTEREARDLLGRVQATGRFPGANIRRMQAVLDYP